MDLALKLLLLLLFVIPAAYGHGGESETVGPIVINGQDVSLEISSSADDPELADGHQISISLIGENMVTLRDIVFEIRAERGNTILFDDIFAADYGFIVFNFESADGPITITEEESSSFFASLLGFESRLIHVSGPGLADGGLYKFAINIPEAEGIMQDPQTLYAGVSIPQTTRYEIDDPNYGAQHINVISYYDTIHDFEYDPYSRHITYSMPFEWTIDNINQTLVVHEEISFPKEYGDLLASGFIMEINGIRLSDEVVNIDDFAFDSRIVHFTIFRDELVRLLDMGFEDGMDIMIRPDLDHIRQGVVTDNGQFRVYASSGGLSSGDMGAIEFEVTDVFLRGAPIAVPYELAIVYDGDTIHEQSGTSPDKGEPPGTIQFKVPEITGIIHVEIILDGNERATSSIPMVINRIHIPDGARDIALQWSQGGNVEFAGVAGGIAGTDVASVPSWLAYAAGLWGSGDMSDAEFADIVRYLAGRGAIY